MIAIRTTYRIYSTEMCGRIRLALECIAVFFFVTIDRHILTIRRQEGR